MNDNRKWVNALCDLLTEAFEGIPEGADGTWFVQGKEGIFDAFTSVNSDQASRRVSANCATMAAHAVHILYVLRLANVQHGGTTPEGTWEDTWKKQEVTHEEWITLTQDIAKEYERLVHGLSMHEDWSVEYIHVSFVAVLAHLSYHLGALRQILTVVRDNGNM